MEKTDARVRYTRRVLKESFLKLLREKPVNKITVKEVCELAELNRSTFYAHYDDCFDLMDSIEQELLEEFMASLALVRPFDVTALIEAIYAMIEAHKEACRVLVFDRINPPLTGKMIALARKSSIESWKKQLPRASEEDLEMLYLHLSAGLMNVVVSGYDRYPKEDVVRFVGSIVSSSLKLFS